MIPLFLGKDASGEPLITDLTKMPHLLIAGTTGSGKSELEIPFAQEFLVRIDLEAKRIEMKLPEGLLDVNAPLSEEEKKRQRH